MMAKQRKSAFDNPKTKPVVISGNRFASLDGKDGNPHSPAEFDASHHGSDELYFKADEDATDADKIKVLLLNFIHQELHYDIERQVPAITKNSFKDIEVYHRATYNGVELDVCVYWPPRDAGDYKRCIAMVKLISDELLGDNDGAHTVIAVDAAWTKKSKKDKFTTKIEDMTKNYWAPRWKYVVKSLRDTMAYDYEQNGVVIVHPDEPDEDDQIAQAAVENGAEIEEEFEVFAGSTGKIIGPKGTKINEIKDTTRVKDIKMPKKDEDAPRPRARDPAIITVIGTRSAIDKAKKMIKAVVDEWANAPRPPRERGSGGYGGSEPTYQALDTGYSAPDLTTGSGGGWDSGTNAALDAANVATVGDWDSNTKAGDGVNPDDVGATDSWADDANAAASASNGGSGWEGGGGSYQW